jgi:hypothetical protein
MNAAATQARMPAFLITIDTEGDDLWHRPRKITTRNTAYLPRFAQLCEEFGFKPTWLTNYEMAMDPDFVRFGRDILRRGSGEIGMHLHPWNSPPIASLTDDDCLHQPYLVEYPPEAMEAKIEFMTQLLHQRFEAPIVSHRAGRWALNSTYAKLLARYGYQIDCSVTPQVSWAEMPGDPAGSGGTDYRGFPDQPYVMDLERIDQAGQSPILELPVSVIRSRLSRWAPLAYRLPWLRRLAWHHQPDLLWLYPDCSNLSHMLCVVQEAVAAKRPYLELVLHSSELMPGGRETVRDAASIDHLYSDLKALFTVAARSFAGMTLAEFRKAWLSTQAQASQARAGRQAHRPWLNRPLRDP